MKFAHLALALCLASGVASAQTTQAYVWYPETNDNGNAVACSSGTCTRSIPTASEFSRSFKPVGLNLLNISGYMLHVCAPPGVTLTGTGTLEAYVWVPWADTKVSRNKALDVTISDFWDSASPQCFNVYDMKTAFSIYRRVLYRANGVGVTGTPSTSATGLDVVLFGGKEIR